MLHKSKPAETITWENHLPAILILILAFVGMTTFTWQKWADPITDFGVQMYIPWQISLGKVLYQDIHYHMGPLSSYLHAILFNLFGPGILILQAFNLAIIAIITALLYHIFQKISDTLTALFACLTFLFVFAFGHYQALSVFNFVSPYHYESTHGLFLSLVAFQQFIKYMDERTPRRLLKLGCFVGLVFLTKTEIFLATFVAISLGLLTLYIKSPVHPRVFIKNLALYFLAIAFPSFLFFIFFSIHMSFEQAWATILYPWTFLGDASPLSQPFYRTVTGIGDIPGNMKIILIYTGIYISLFGLVYILNHFFKKCPANTNLLGIFYSIVILGIGWLFKEDIAWLQLLKPLPVIMLGLICVNALALCRKNLEIELLKHYILLISLGLFSLLLLLKVLLNARVSNFGFVLCVPGTLLFVKLVLFDLRNRIQLFSGYSFTYRAVSISLLLLFFTGHIFLTSSYYEKKVFPIGKDADQFYGFTPFIWDRGLMVKITLEFINEEMDEKDDFVVFPRGVMLNYLTRRENSIGYTFMDPFAVQMFGESAILNALQSKPPAYIILANWSFEEFGKTYFGRDFGQSIYSWIFANYKTTRQIGAEIGAKIVEEKGIGFQIMKRN